MKIIERTQQEMADMEAKRNRAKTLKADLKLLEERVKKEPMRFVRVELTAEEWDILKGEFQGDDITGEGTWKGLPVKREKK